MDLKELGPWIDGLDPEGKERIAAATNWGYTSADIDSVPDGERYNIGKGRVCIVDHADGFTPGQIPSWLHTYGEDPADWFDELCETYGLEPVVAACKARAGE